MRKKGQGGRARARARALAKAVAVALLVDSVAGQSAICDDSRTPPCQCSALQPGNNLPNCDLKKVQGKGCQADIDVNEGNALGANTASAIAELAIASAKSPCKKQGGKQDGVQAYRCDWADWAKVQEFNDFDKKCKSTGGTLSEFQGGDTVLLSIRTNDLGGTKDELYYGGRFLCKPKSCQERSYTIGYQQYAEADVCHTILKERKADLAACSAKAWPGIGFNHTDPNPHKPTSASISATGVGELQVQNMTTFSNASGKVPPGILQPCADALVRLDGMPDWRESIKTFLEEAETAGCFGDGCLETGDCTCDWQVKTRIGGPKGTPLRDLYKAAMKECSDATEEKDARGHVVVNGGGLCDVDQDVATHAFELFPWNIGNKLNTFTVTAATAICAPRQCTKNDMDQFLTWYNNQRGGSYASDACLMQEGVAGAGIQNSKCTPSLPPKGQCPPPITHGFRIGPWGLAGLVLGLIGGVFAARRARRSYQNMTRKRRRKKAAPDVVQPYALMGEEGAAPANPTVPPINYEYDDDDDDDDSDSDDDGTSPHLMSVHMKLEGVGKIKKSWKQRMAERARARKAKQTRMGGGRRADRIAAEAAEFAQGANVSAAPPSKPSSIRSKLSFGKGRFGKKGEEPLFDQDTGEPLNETARVARSTEVEQPDFDELTGAPLNEPARRLVAGPAAASTSHHAPLQTVTEEPEFDEMTGAPLNEAARCNAGSGAAGGDEPEFDETTGAPLNEAARRVLEQND